MNPVRSEGNPFFQNGNWGSPYFPSILLENTHQLIGLLSSEGVILEINLPTLKAYNLQRDDVVGKHLWDTLWWREQPEDQQLLKESIREASQGKITRFTIKVPAQDRKTATIDFTLRPVKDSNGETSYIIPEVRDISDLVESINELRQIQKMLEQANRIAGLGYWTWDIQTDQVGISDELRRIFTEDEDAGINNYKSLMRSVHPEDRVVVRRVLQSALNNDSEFAVQFRITRVDGLVRTLRSMGQVIRDSSGAPIQVVSTVQDITEIKSLETRLIDSEQRYRFLVQALPNTVVVLYDIEMRVFLIEGRSLIEKISFEKTLLGLSVAEVMDQLLGEHSEQETDFFKDVFEKNTHAYEQISGEECYSVSLVPLRNNDNEIYAGMAVIQDITQRIRIAEKLTRLADQLGMLNHLGQVVVSNQDTQTIFREVLPRIRDMIGAEGVFIFLEKNGRLVIEAQDLENGSDLIGKGMPTTEGIGGQVWQNQQGILLSGDECLDRLFKPLARSLGFTPLSFLAVPVTWGDRNFGVFEAIHIEEGKFTQDDLKLADSAAAWTAIALNNAQQRQQMERRVAESETTSRLLGEILSANLTLESVLQHVVDAGRSIVPSVDWSAIHLLDERDNKLRLEALSGVTVPVEEYTLQPGQGIAGRVFESGQLINVADVSQDERVAGFPRYSHAHSLLVAPIYNRDGVVIGTITLQSSQAGQFTAEDEHLLQLLSNQTGIAIENARLFESAEYRRRVAQFQQERLRSLTHRMVTAQENERERIARELHDEAGQSLTALKISMELLSNSLPEDMREERQSLIDAAEQIGSTMENLRSLAHNLHPPALDRLGLNLALASLCQQFESLTHIHTEYQGIELPRLPSSHEINIYRFVQEALTNIAKHADASEVNVRLDTQTGQIEIHVQDNGKGFQATQMDFERADSDGMGLTSMEERLNIINGRLEVQSVLGKGTYLRAIVDLRLREELR